MTNEHPSLTMPTPVYLARRALGLLLVEIGWRLERFGQRVEREGGRVTPWPRDWPSPGSVHGTRGESS